MRCAGSASSAFGAARATARRCARRAGLVAEGNLVARAPGGNAAALRPSRRDAAGRADDRDAGRRAGDPVRSRHLRLVADRTAEVRGRLGRADGPRRPAAEPQGLRGSGRARGRGDRAPLAPGRRSVGGGPAGASPTEPSEAGSTRSRSAPRRGGVRSPLRACHTERMASTATRNLGRLSEIAQVAVRHGFGYFFETHRLTDLLPGRQPKLTPEGLALAARPAPARAARRARPDLRQVRPAALDAARHRPAGHPGRAPVAPGRRASRSRTKTSSA